LTLSPKLAWGLSGKRKRPGERSKQGFRS